MACGLQKARICCLEHFSMMGCETAIYTACVSSFRLLGMGSTKQFGAKNKISEAPTDMVDDATVPRFIPLSLVLQF